LDVSLIFVLLADEVKFVLGLFLYSVPSHVPSISSDYSEYNASMVLMSNSHQIKTLMMLKNSFKIHIKGGFSSLWVT